MQESPDRDNHSEEEGTGYAFWYDEAVPRIVEHSDLFFTAVLSSIPGTAGRVLELGSGTGYLTQKIRNRFPCCQVTCIDKSEAMVAVAKRKPALSGVGWILGDFRQTWPDATFDVVVSTLCLHHVPDDDRRALFRKIRRSLGPGGRCINGDVFKGGSPSEEAAWREHFFQHLLSSGFSRGLCCRMLAGREQTCSSLVTQRHQADTMREAGFEVREPYRDGMYGVLVGVR